MLTVNMTNEPDVILNSLSLDFHMKLGVHLFDLIAPSCNLGRLCISCLPLALHVPLLL